MSDPAEPMPHDVAVKGSSGTESQPPSVVLEVDSLAGGGRGVGRVEGQVWMVEGALPGDRIAARPIRRHRTWIEARTLSVLRPSPDRREPPCPLQPSCGGCPWMCLEESAQRRWKKRIVQDALERIGRVDRSVVEEILPSPRSLGYRNKTELTFGRDGEGRRVLGFHPPGDPATVVDVDRCLLQPEEANRVLGEVRAFFLKGPGVSDPTPDRPPGAWRLVIRVSSRGRIVVGLRGPGGRFPSVRRFAREIMERCPEVAGVVRIVARGRKRGGARSVLLAGEEWIMEEAAGIPVPVPAASFYQVNPGAADLLAARIVEMAAVRPATRVLDLYGGVGVFGLRLAREGAEVIVVDADAEAVACGKKAAWRAKVGKVSFVHDRISRFLATEPGRSFPADLVVADPPRSGLDRGVSEHITAMAPRRIVLVSCDPATLARDLRAFCGARYAVQKVVAVDLFPQTPHVEAAALLVRESDPRPSPPGGSPPPASG